MLSKLMDAYADAVLDLFTLEGDAPFVLWIIGLFFAILPCWFIYFVGKTIDDGIQWINHETEKNKEF